MSGPITLSADEATALRALVEAGRDGVPLGRDLSWDLARSLTECGFAVIHDGRRFTAHATGQGKTFHRRTAS